MTHEEALDEIVRLAAKARMLLAAPPPTHLDGHPIPEADRGEVGRAQVVLHVTKLRKLAGALSVRLAEEVVP